MTNTNKKGLPNYTSHLITNRQWMESLSDEELARKSFYIVAGANCPLYASTLPNPNKELQPSKEKVIEENINWLQAEHKELVR